MLYFVLYFIVHFIMFMFTLVKYNMLILQYFFEKTTQSIQGSFFVKKQFTSPQYDKRFAYSTKCSVIELDRNSQ